jgi:hypothetical protein
MSARRFAGAMVFAAALAAVGSCDGGPKAGPVDVALSTGTSEVGAVMFTVTAAAPNTIDTVEASCAGCAAYMTRVSDTEVRAIVTGGLISGSVAHVTVSDIKVPEDYTAQLTQMALSTYALASTAGSQLTVGPISQ